MTAATDASAGTPGTPGVPDTAALAALLDAAVVLFASDGRHLTVDDSHPRGPAAQAATVSIPVGFGVTGLVARNGTPVLLDDDSPRDPAHRALLGLADGATIARLCVPLPGVAGTVVGVLAAHRPAGRPFDETDLARLVPVAALVGLRLHARMLWREAHQHRSERDRLIAQAISAQEAERRRIAFDLHDGVTTALASMAFHLSAADLSAAAGRTEQARAEMRAARRLSDLAYQSTRAAISGLHSLVLDDLGLVAALESLVQDLHGQGPELDLFVDHADDFTDLPDHVAAALYRIAQECLANAVRHSGAERVVLSLRRVADSVVLGCTDDGVGFDHAERRSRRSEELHAGGEHLGLSSIEERCALIEASLRIESISGRGTTVLVELPLDTSGGAAASGGL